MRPILSALALALAAPALANDETPPAEPGAAATEPSIPRHRLYYENLSAVRLNPLGLQEYFTLGYRLRLVESDNVLFKDTYLWVGPTVNLSPAFVKGGAMVQIMPIAVLRLTARYRGQYYFGTFDQIQSWSDTSVNWSDSAMKASNDQAYATGGHNISLEVRVQGKVGPVAVRNTSVFHRNWLDVTDGTDLYYDQTFDILAPADGWFFVNDLDVLGLFLDGAPLKVGARYTYTAPYYGNGDRSEGNDTHRVGPLIAYTFKDKPGSRFDAPTALLLAQWHVKHPNRAGQDVHQAFPYLALAFLFQGDLVPW